MSGETLEQIKARIERQDEEKEEAFQKSLKEIKGANKRWRAEQEEKERAAERARQKLREDLRKKREEETKDRMRLSWLDAGGAAEEFEQEWPKMRSQMLRERVLGRDSEARREAFERNIKAF